jgi:glutathione-regulated potassium-efflux system ancillary protein KefC
METHSLIEMLIYLGSAALIVPIAVRSGLGPVLGYLIAGCVIGPWGLKLVTDVESILQFAEIGVVLMLFIIGLELDPKRLWAMRRMVFGGGALQMLACGIAIAIFCAALGLNWTAALLVGLTLSLSSTAIAMQAMSERNMNATAVGRKRWYALRCGAGSVHCQNRGCNCRSGSFGSVRLSARPPLCSALWPERNL